MPLVEIQTFNPSYANAFHDLNVEWLEKFFTVEPVDREVLSNPVTNIIEPGGQILFAVASEKPIGCVALLCQTDGVELTKMAVTEAFQGRGIGRRLLDAAIEYWREKHTLPLYLETNSSLKNAIHLYESVGFVLQPGGKPSSHYARSDTYMIYGPANSSNKGG